MKGFGLNVNTTEHLLDFFDKCNIFSIRWICPKCIPSKVPIVREDELIKSFTKLEDFNNSNFQYPQDLKNFHKHRFLL